MYIFAQIWLFANNSGKP